MADEVQTPWFLELSRFLEGKGWLENLLYSSTFWCVYPNSSKRSANEISLKQRRAGGEGSSVYYVYQILYYEVLQQGNMINFVDPEPFPHIVYVNTQHRPLWPRNTCGTGSSDAHCQKNLPGESGLLRILKEGSTNGCWLWMLKHWHFYVEMRTRHHFLPQNPVTMEIISYIHFSQSSISTS